MGLSMSTIADGVRTYTGTFQNRFQKSRTTEMSVYVDSMGARYGRMIMCHMMADTTEELLEMADKIGVKRKWIQSAGTWREHFDICLSMRAKAVKFGAIEKSSRELVMLKSPLLNRH